MIRIRHLGMVTALAALGAVAPNATGRPVRGLQRRGQREPVLSKRGVDQEPRGHRGLHGDRVLPGPPDTRLAMAAFMTRLGDRLSPTILSAVANGGTFNLDIPNPSPSTRDPSVARLHDDAVHRRDHADQLSAHARCSRPTSRVRPAARCRSSGSRPYPRTAAPRSPTSLTYGHADVGRPARARLDPGLAIHGPERDLRSCPERPTSSHTWCSARRRTSAARTTSSSGAAPSRVSIFNAEVLTASS